MTRALFPPEFFVELARQGARQKMGMMGERPEARRGDQVPGFERRRWQTGDRRRQVDWRATARLGHPVVRSLERERGGHLCLVLDRSASMAPQNQNRDVAQRRLCLALAWLALEQGARISIFAGTDHAAQFSGWARRAAVIPFLENLSAPAGTDVVHALKSRPEAGSALHVLSDPWCSADTLQAWSLLTPGFQQCQWTSLVLPEENAPPKQSLGLQPAEGGPPIQVNLNQDYGQFQNSWEAFRQSQREGLAAAGFHSLELLCQKAEIDAVGILRRAARHGVL
ncbi:MAG: DUF58 domain-containing protein [Planctomycetota bacterium]|nr:DUF58 domain-containing protein [Planctomycetota bacterium]MDA1113013.1 DUF58 domain-containing protein [Planctomycetota bacterium]